MNSETKEFPAKKPQLATYLIIAVAAAAAGFAAVYVNYGQPGNADGPATVERSEPARLAPAPPAAVGDTALAAFVKGDMATFVPLDEPAALPAFSINDAEGNPRTIADWKGKVVLLNLWATWCAPCRKEMPSLDRLEAELGGADFEVVAASVDRGSPSKPRAFFEEIGVKHLKLYHDPAAKLGTTLKAYGMPTTLLINREGKEIGRLVGPAEWDSEDALALLRAVIGKAG